MHEVITRSQSNGEPNPGSDDEQPDAPPPHTHRRREANSQERTRCSSGVSRERNSRHSQYTHESGFLNDSPRRLRLSLPYYALSLPLFSSLPPSQLQPFPCQIISPFPIPFRLVNVVSGMPEGGSRGGKREGVSPRRGSHARVSSPRSSFGIQRNQEFLCYIITSIFTLTFCKNTVSCDIKRSHKRGRTNNKTNEARGDLLRQASPLRRLPSLGNSFCEWNGNTAGIWDDWNPHGARAARLIPVPVVLSLSALRDVIGAIGSVGRGRLKGPLRRWWATASWLEWIL